MPSSSIQVCNRDSFQVSKKFKSEKLARCYQISTELSVIPEEDEGQQDIGEENIRSTTSDQKHFSSCYELNLGEVRKNLNLIEELGWSKFWGKADGNCGLISADVLATVLWVAEVVEALGTLSRPDHTQLLSIKLSRKSVEFSLQYSREGLATKIIPQVRGQLKSILDRVGVTEAEFLPLAKVFTASLNKFENTILFLE